MIIKNPEVWFEGEQAGEEVLFMMRPHPITNVSWVSITIFLLVILPLIIAAGLLAQSVSLPLSALTIFLSYLTWALLVLGGTFQWYLHWIFNIYILTNRRVVDIDFIGLFHRRISQAALRNIQDVTFTKHGIFQNFFDYGNIHIQTAGTNPNFEFKAIPDPEGSLKQILDLVARVRKGQPDHANTGEAGNKLN